MKKFSTIILLILLFVLTLTLFACNKDEQIEQDTSPLTINAPLNSREYFLKIKEYVKRDLGIDLEVKFEYQVETSNYYLQQAKNGNLTDIIYSYLTPDDETLENNFLDLSDLDIASLFSSSQLQTYATNKKIYRLPLSSTIIGITYNKTLFTEMEWNLPSNLEELKDLAIEITNAGYEISSSNNAATGFGWNYLFNFAGSEYLNTIDGNNWLQDFVNGKETSASNLTSSLDYLTELRDLGLFGTITSKWDSSYTNQHRCAFYVGMLGGTQFYNGYRLDDNNQIIGATYFPAIIKEDGSFTTEFSMIEDENGDYVFVDSKYIPYESKYESLTKYNPSIKGKLTYLFEVEEDPNGAFVWINNGENSNYSYYSDTNESHIGLTRYKVKGENTEYLNDEYAIMPFISSKGTNNCFVEYGNNIFGLNKNLENKNQKDRLEKANQVLMYIATNSEALELSLKTPTAYLATTDFEITQDRMYYDYRDKIKNGYLMDWYYSYFDSTVIVNVGEVVNNYLSKTPMEINGETRLVTTQDIINTLEQSQSNVLSNQVPSYGNMGETLNVKDTAELLIKASSIELQKEINKIYSDMSIEVAMIPYAESLFITDINDAATDIIRLEAQKGDITATTINCYYPGSIDDIVAVKLTGLQIKTMQQNGYDSNKSSDSNTIAPWLVVTKGNLTIEDNVEYIVAIPQALINSNYTVLKDNSNNVITVTFKDSLLALCDTLGTIYLKDIAF